MAGKTVSPTRMELSRLKRVLATATRGHKLLKDKRDEMMRRFIEMIRTNRVLRLQVEEELASAMREFVLARAMMTGDALESAVLVPARSVALDIGVRNIMSVRVPKIGIDLENIQELQLPYGFAETTEQLDAAIARLASILPQLATLAEVEKACDMLSDEIEKTRRRVNALEFVMIPQTQETIRDIRMKLDENERGNLSRLMKVKDMMVKQQAEANGTR